MQNERLNSIAQTLENNRLGDVMLKSSIIFLN